MYQKVTRCLALLGILGVTLAGAQTAWAKTSDDAFYKAYYLETERGDPAGAIELYEQALSRKDLSRELRDNARHRLAICREDVVSSDFARLMPPETFAYVELGPVGNQVKSLLGQLGLMVEGGSGEGGKLAVHQALVDELLGFRGAAVGITGINFDEEEPEGVLVIHPGNLEVIRAALKTALPVGGIPQEPIGGFATFDIEGEVLVTLTHRLLVVADNRAHIEGVVSRLQGIKKDSLATQPAIEAVANSRGRSLLSFFVRTEPIRPMIESLIKQEGMRDPEFAMVDAMLDLRSIRTLAGHVGVSDDGLEAQVALHLDEGHRNLVYNLIRTNPVDGKTLKSIPGGAAALAVVGLSGFQPNDRGHDEATADVVTGLDLGREIFANVAGIGLYVLPKSDGRSGSGPIPNVGATITVNDPAASEAIWRQLLGLASLASGAGTPEGVSETIDSVDVTRYSFTDGPVVRFASIENTILVGLTREAMAKAIDTQRGGDSILADQAFAGVLSSLTDDCTKAVMIHPGRMFAVLSPMMDSDERAEIEPFLPLLADTVASFTVDHGEARLGVSLRVDGLPEVSGVLDQLIAGYREEKVAWHTIEREVSRGSYEEAIREIDEMLERKPGETSLVRKKFELLARSGDVSRAMDVGQGLYRQISDDATALNNVAWALVTEDTFKGRFTELAVKMSERSNALVPDNWMFVDTLAWAKFEKGDVKEAVDLERKAIALAGDRSNDALHDALARFERGLASRR